LEQTNNSKLIVIGGSKVDEYDEEHAIIGVLRIADLKCRFTETFEGTEDRVFSCITRYKDTDIIFAATFSKLHIFSIESKRFSKIAKVDQLHVGVEAISSIVLRDSEAYCCADGDDYVSKIEFELTLEEF